MGTSVHLAAVVQSTSERASGLASTGDELNITVTHRGNSRGVRLRLKAHTFRDGTLRLSLREIYPSGQTRLIWRDDVGAIVDEADPTEALDITELASPPALQIKRTKC